MKGAPHCALWMLKAQILNVVKCDSSVEKLWNNRKGKLRDSLVASFSGKMTLPGQLSIKIGCFLLLTHFVKLSSTANHYEQNGITEFDCKFLDGERHRSQLEMVGKL